MAYTLQSTITGKYITELFSDNHHETFGTTDIYQAYSFKSKEHLTKLINTEPKILNCDIVEIPVKSE